MADTGSAESGSLETREDAGKGGAGTVRMWLSALDLASAQEKDWRKRAEHAVERYRDEKDRKGARFNILYSSIQTQQPAMYNSTPRPDVRRRFGDEDPVGKVAAQAFERSLSHSLDEYDFDCTIGDVIFDSLLPGRGVALVAYAPVVGEEGVDYESVRCEHVQWDDFRRGPGKRWEDVPWLAVRYRITRDQAIALNKEAGPTVNLDHVEKGADKENKDVPDIFKRLTVWKIWDKEKRQIVYIAPSYKDGPFRVDADPLGLRDFFPFPRPLYDVQDSGSLVPLVPYDMYRDQAEELDRVTKRIHSLVNVLRWRGIRPSQIEELDRLKDAEDGELIPSQSMDALALSGMNADHGIWIMPIDKLIQVIRELVLQREAIKQVVFEISGLADIMRGETDPNETLGAQQIKAQWGSMRMQKRQREVQRFIRDLLRIKAEIIGEHYAPETLQMVTGISLPTPEQKASAQMLAQRAQMAQQPLPPDLEMMLSTPTWADVKQVMASDASRSFRVDIETDSTIEADQTRAQQNIAQFIEGLASFGTAIGPAVQSGMMGKDIAADLLTGFARNFKLGRQAEDALERWGKEAKQPQEPQPDPEAEKAKAQLQIEQQKAQQDAALEQQRAQQQAQIAAQQAQAEEARKQREAEVDAQIARMKAEEDIRVEQMKAAAKLEIERMMAGVKADIARQQADAKAEADRKRMQRQETAE